MHPCYMYLISSLFTNTTLMVAKFFFLLFALNILLVPLPCRAHGDFRIALRRLDSSNNMTQEKLVKRAVHRSKYRMGLIGAMMTNSSLDVVQAPLHFGNEPFEYYMDLAIGTPPLHITAVMDTGSDLVWTQCQPCVQLMRRSKAIYYPSKSSTFSMASCATSLCQALGADSSCNDAGDCVYSYLYADRSMTQGVLGYETLTFGDSSVDRVGFGCGIANTGFYTGIVGLGQGALSLPSQLNTGKFSYCLTMASSSLLLLGPSASLNGSSTGRVQSTSFLSDRRWYFISLRGISIGASLLPIPSTTFQYNTDGTGGTIIDSGTSLTLLQQPAYNILKRELVSLVSLPVVDVKDSFSLDLCFQMTSWPPPDMPDMTLHFDGADMTVPPENYMLADQGSGLLCLLMLPTDFSASILGNFLQQNMHILYDLNNRVLSFVPAQCHQL